MHNLRATQRGVAANQAYDWAMEFDGKVAAQLEKGDLAGLADFQKLGQVAQLAHPTHEHYLPLLYAAGAVDAKEAHALFQQQLPIRIDLDAVGNLGLGRHAGLDPASMAAVDCGASPQ